MTAMDADLLNLLVRFAGFIAFLILVPLLGWCLQGLKPRRGGVASSAMDGFASVFDTQQTRLQDAKREKNKGGRENGEPPDQRNG